MIRGKKLGILLSTGPDHPAFLHGLGLAEAALAEGVQVYLYCIDQAVVGAGDPRLERLVARGLKLFACAYGAHRRGLALAGPAVYSGLVIVSDLVAATDRFVGF